MSDLRRQRMLQDIAVLRRVERDAAYQHLSDAEGKARAADAAVERAQAAADDAERAWGAYLGGTNFAPEHARALAGLLVAGSEAARSAEHEQRRARAAVEALEHAWHGHDALCRRAERAEYAGRRVLRRDRDERQVAASADRTSLQWSQS